MSPAGPPPFAPSPDDSRLARGLLLAGVLVSLAFAFISQNPYDTGDSLQHYFYARFAPQHPLNLLESWAKPLFTLLMTGPAQLGFRGVVLTQCALVAASAWLSYRVARGLGLPCPALAILFCYTAPDYFRIQFSGLTEPLFGFILIGGVALAVADRPGWSAALVSWLPFVRSEGFILLGIWAVYLGWRRQWRWLALLPLGYVVYSLVGAVVLGDLGWVFARNPYSTVSPYGAGSWDHFVVGLLYLLNWVGAVLVVLGLAQLLRRLSRRPTHAQPLGPAELLLVYGVAFTFVAAHTVFWRFGLFGSFGLLRVLTVLTPLLTIIGLRGLELLLALGRTPRAQGRLARGVAAAMLLISFLGLNMGFRWQRDFGQPGDLTLAEQAAAWYRQQPAAPLLVVEHPGLIQALDVDMFSPRVWVLANPQRRFRPQAWPAGTLVFWDDWFSRVEGHLTLPQLRADPRFRQRWTGAFPRHPASPDHDTAQVFVFEKIR